MIIEPGNIFYRHIKPEDVEEIVTRTLKGGETIDRLFYTDPVSGEAVETRTGDSLLRRDRTGCCWATTSKLSPTEIGEYIAHGGYSALVKVLSGMTPAAVIEEVKASGLRGRGGGGYPDGTQVGAVLRPPRETNGTLSATPTKATRGRTWTAACWRATRTPSWKA